MFLELSTNPVQSLSKFLTLCSSSETLVYIRALQYKMGKLTRGKGWKKREVAADTSDHPTPARLARACRRQSERGKLINLVLAITVSIIQMQTGDGSRKQTGKSITASKQAFIILVQQVNYCQQASAHHHHLNPVSNSQRVMRKAAGSAGLIDRKPARARTY